MPHVFRCAAALLPLFALVGLACGDSGETDDTGGGAEDGGGGAGTGGATTGGGDAGGGDTGGGGVGGMTTEDFTVGGDRPVEVHLPDDYDPSVPAPLVILLHGYTASGAIQDAYFGFTPVARSMGFISLAPDGTTDGNDSQFWNATDACCNFFQSPVDDSAYLMGLVDEISERANVDPSRVYFIGHSNGGFMSYRMACDHADRIAAIVSLAGATYLDPADCEPSEPVSVLQIHGTEDETIFYDGGNNIGTAYPGARASVEQWATYDACTGEPAAGAARDLEATLAGDESTAEAYATCDASTTVELWTIQDALHVPDLADDFTEQALTWLLAHEK